MSVPESNAPSESKLHFNHSVRREKENYIIAQKSFSIELMEQTEKKLENVVWLNAAEIEGLFGGSSSKRKYVRIADQVYRVGCAELKKGWIGLANHHLDEAGKAVFDGKTGHRVSVCSVDRHQLDRSKVKRVEVLLSSVKDVFSSNQTHVLLLSEIRNKLYSRLRREFLVNERSFIMQFDCGTLLATIEDMELAEPIREGNEFPLGVIDKETVLDVYVQSDPRIIIADRLLSSEVEQFRFSLSLAKRNSKAQSYPTPIVISEISLIRQIRENLKGRKICKNHLLLIPHHSGWDICVTLKQVFLKPDATASQNSEFSMHDYEDAYLLTEKSNIKFRCAQSILLTESKRESAQAMHFHIGDIPGAQPDPRIEIDKVRWICKEEFSHKLQEKMQTLVVGQKFEITLSSGTFLVQLDRVQPNSSVSGHEASEIEKCWMIDAAVNIHLTADPALQLNLVPSDTIYPLKKVVFELRGERMPENGLQMTQEELQRQVMEHAPKNLVVNREFSWFGDKGQRLVCSVSSQQFEEDIHREKGLTCFGGITENTEIEFFVSQGNSLILVDKVFQDEIEKMIFTVQTKKREKAPGWARLPLVLDAEKLTRDLVKKIEEEDLLFFNYSTLLEHGDGWDLLVRLKTVVLDKSARKSAVDTDLIGSLSRTGYRLGDATRLELTKTASDVALVSAKPSLAKIMNFRIVEMKEDYTNQSAEIVKGNWINEEEFKEALLAEERSFVVGQRFVVELESGKYIAEIRYAKPADGMEEEKQYKSVWNLDADSKINLAIDQKLDISVVKSRISYPLKKIKLEVFPEDKASEHISLKEKELRNAFLEKKPEKIVLNQLFTFETESNHTVRMMIEEMHFDKKKWIGGTMGCFGRITENTEIVIAGKEESHLAIRSNPKILEIEDPVHYLQELGLGGIEKEFRQIYRIFFSRSEKLGSEARRRGTTPIRGILLYGPPGTGKTTLARHIGEMLGCSGERLKMITSTEIKNMWYGKSEEKVRELFLPAREASEKYQEKSPLYVLVIDEIDGMLPPRGGSTNKVNDSIVNQFLGEMDGLNQLNNLLVIGITNRKDEIDPAALRHGRFGAHIEIPIPDAKGREKIFEIYLKKLEEEGVLGEGVDVEELARLTPKFTGADIAGLVEEATLFSLERLHKHKDLPKAELEKHPDGIVTRKDFLEALEQKTREPAMDLEYQRAMYS